MIRAIMFVLGVIAFGVGLNECRTGERSITCSDYERRQQGNECFGRSKGAHVRRGFHVQVGGAAGMAAGLFFVVMAFVNRKK
jgi:hypothetical protein